MAWVALVAAGLFETAFAVCLKLSHGFSVPWPTAGFAASALASFGLLTLALSGGTGRRHGRAPGTGAT